MTLTRWVPTAVSSNVNDGMKVITVSNGHKDLVPSLFRVLNRKTKSAVYISEVCLGV